jgi:hypothetical protein
MTAPIAARRLRTADHVGPRTVGRAVAADRCQHRREDGSRRRDAEYVPERPPSADAQATPRRRPDRASTELLLGG